MRILKEYPNKRILVCAPSDAAADVIALRLIKEMEPSQLYRLNWWQRIYSSVPVQLLSYCLIYNGFFDIYELDLLMKFRVIVSTCSAAGAMAIFGNDVKFDVVMIDEAAQATEAETIIPLTLCKPGGVMILAGDIYQLGPLIHFPLYRDCCSYMTLQERLLSLPFYENCLPHRQSVTTERIKQASGVSLGGFLCNNYR